MDIGKNKFDKLFKNKGCKYKCIYLLGFLDNPDTVKVVDQYFEDYPTVQELENGKRELMKKYKLPVIKTEVEKL